MLQHRCPWCGAEINTSYVWKSTFLKSDCVNSFDEDGQPFVCPHCNKEVGTVIQGGFLLSLITSFFWSYAYRNIIFTFADFASWGWCIAMIVIDSSIIFVWL